MRTIQILHLICLYGHSHDGTCHSAACSDDNDPEPNPNPDPEVGTDG